jgi:pimeloyl-ACP methyl ester carboxylesterase
MSVDVARISTADGFRLFGLGHGLGQTGVAVLYVHGLGGNGFTLFSDDLAIALPRAGHPFVRGNLRTADLLRIDEFPESGEVRKGGGAFHRFDDCVPDIAAWLDYLESHGHHRVVLLGHSLGSLASTHYLGVTGDPRVVGLVLASTADLIAMHENRYPADQRDAFAALAERMVVDGRGDELMPTECGMGLLRQPVSAGAYLDRFGAEPAWDVMDLYGRGSERAFTALRRVRVPILALFGTVNETVPADRVDDALAVLRDAAELAPSFRTAVLDGANHFYTGHGERLASDVLAWLGECVDPRS